MFDGKGVEDQHRLEESLWIAQTRFDSAWSESVFAPNFTEVGRSGRDIRDDELRGFVKELK